MASTSIWCCCAAGWRAVASSSTALALREARQAVASWQAEVVRLLRAAAPAAQGAAGRSGAAQRRRALARARRGDPRAGAGAGDRRRASGPARSQPGGGRAAASAPPGVALAGVNLRRYWQFDGRDRHALRSLLGAPFPLPGRAMWRRASTGSRGLTGQGPAPFASATAGGRSNVMKMPRFYVMGWKIVSIFAGAATAETLVS